jgi:phosphoserine aminotransferase
VAQSEWIAFLAECESIRSNTSICFKIVDARYAKLSEGEQRAKAKELVGLLEREGVAYDVGAYRQAPPGLRVWGGATVERGDIEALLPWLDWAFAQVGGRI